MNVNEMQAVSPLPTAAGADVSVAKRESFRRAFAKFDPALPVLILAHNDADGLASAALFSRALARIARRAEVRIVGRGESPWSEAMRAELAGRHCGGLIVADLGCSDGVIKPGTPTVIVDHHVPRGSPPGAVVISGYREEPAPTSGLLAFWCAGELAEVDDLLWIAAISIIGDMAESAGFPELEAARRRYGISALRAGTSLLNAARRSGSGDAQPAFNLLMKAEGPREVTSGVHPETATLQTARDEVRSALDEAKRIPPRIVGDVALIQVHSPCQVHPVLAQTWRNRLKGKIVLAANSGFRPGWVHFSVRSDTGLNLVEFLRERAPSSADENYGSGHEQATGGALTHDGWNEFVRGLGFGAEARVAA